MKKGAATPTSNDDTDRISFLSRINALKANHLKKYFEKGGAGERRKPGMGILYDKED